MVVVDNLWSVLVVTVMYRPLWWWWCARGVVPEILVLCWWRPLVAGAKPSTHRKWAPTERRKRGEEREEEKERRKTGREKSRARSAVKTDWASWL